MAYKDPDKQREANKKAMQRLRAKNAGSALSGSGKVSQNARGWPVANYLSDTRPVIPLCDDLKVIPERTAQGNIRVSKPGDTDYVPQCETTRAFIEGRDKRPETGKRGKDIKVFEDLPPGVKLIINRLSKDQLAHKSRTAAAIGYQHQFPDRYHSAGVI